MGSKINISVVSYFHLFPALYAATYTIWGRAPIPLQWIAAVPGIFFTGISISILSEMRSSLLVEEDRNVISGSFGWATAILVSVIFHFTKFNPIPRIFLQLVLIVWTLLFIVWIANRMHMRSVEEMAQQKLDERDKILEQIKALAGNNALGPVFWMR